MSLKTVELFVGDRGLTLTGAHLAYLDGIDAVRQWGDTPLMRLINRLPVGSTYLDIGANIGLTAIAGAIARPDLCVVAFEPVPSNADLLDRNVRANEAVNCTVVRSAVGESPGQLTMNNNGPWSVVDVGGAGAVHVPVTTLDAYCIEHLPDTKIDLIKIDVEGYEPNVLAGGRGTIARWSPVIFMEFNSWTLLLAGRSPLVFAQAIWEAFQVESDSGTRLLDPVAFTHDNMVRHGCVEDIILRLRSPSALSLIATSDSRAAEIALRVEIGALRHSTSWRITAPLRFAKSLLAR